MKPRELWRPKPWRAKRAPPRWSLIRKKKAGLPDTCIAGIPPDVSEPPPMMVSQPNRRFSESPYVESEEDVFEKGDRAVDPLPGGYAVYPAEPHLAHAGTGLEYVDSDGSDDDASERDDETSAERGNRRGTDSETELEHLLAADLMVDPSEMDGETACRAAAASRRAEAFRLSNGDAKCDASPLYPVIDFSFHDEGEDELDEFVEECVERYPAQEASDDDSTQDKDTEEDDRR